MDEIQAYFKHDIPGGWPASIAPDLLLCLYSLSTMPGPPSCSLPALLWRGTQRLRVRPPALPSGCAGLASHAWGRPPQGFLQIPADLAPGSCPVPACRGALRRRRQVCGGAEEGRSHRGVEAAAAVARQLTCPVGQSSFSRPPHAVGLLRRHPRPKMACARLRAAGVPVLRGMRSQAGVCTAVCLLPCRHSNQMQCPHNRLEGSCCIAISRPALLRMMAEARDG